MASRAEISCLPSFAVSSEIVSWLSMVASTCRVRRSADFQVCCIAGFQTRRLHDVERHADLEIGDTAGLETCATPADALGSWPTPPQKAKANWTIWSAMTCHRFRQGDLSPPNRENRAAFS